MAGDRRRPHRSSTRVKVGASGYELGGGARVRIDVVSLGQPGQQRNHRRLRGRGWRYSTVIAYEAAQQREPLTAAGGVAAHRRRDAPRPPFENLSVPVDQEVVGDVGPALLGRRVEVIEALQHRGGPLGGVVVRRCAVMNDEEAHIVGRLELHRPFGREIRAPHVAREHDMTVADGSCRELRPALSCRHPWQEESGCDARPAEHEETAACQQLVETLLTHSNRDFGS